MDLTRDPTPYDPNVGREVKDQARHTFSQAIQDGKLAFSMHRSRVTCG